MRHAYRVEQVSIPSDTDPLVNSSVFQITYSKNGAKEKPMILHNEEYVMMMIQEFLRYHSTARVIFKENGGATPIGLVTLETKVERLRAEMREGIIPPSMSYDIHTTPTNPTP